jgi:hypothetical protein
MGVDERLVCLLLAASVLDPYPPSLAIVAFVFGCFEYRYHVSYWLHRPYWILVGRLILFRDRELVSSYKFVRLVMVSFRCIGDEGYFTDLFFGVWWADRF